MQLRYALSMVVLVAVAGSGLPASTTASLPKPLSQRDGGIERVVPAAAPSAAARGGAWAFTLNVWGHSGSEKAPVNKQVLNDVKSSILSRNPKPVNVSLQEVCISYGLWTGFFSWMESQGYGYVWAGVDLPAEDECGFFGNALFFKSSTAEYDHHFMNGNQQNVICARYIVYASATYCTVHAKSADNPTAWSQVVEAGNWMQSRFPAYSYTLAGDFNLSPDQCNQPNSWQLLDGLVYPGGFYEAASNGLPLSCYPTWHSSTSQARLDYAWDRPFSWSSAYVSNWLPHTDHRILEGFL